MFRRMFAYVSSLFQRKPLLLAIVRRYQDAQGHNVGELYRYGTVAGVGGYRMIGCSLDSFPLDTLFMESLAGRLDLEHDFLAPMAGNTLRVGAAEPADNDAVRETIRRMNARDIHLTIQNRFIEHVMNSGSSDRRM